MDNATENTIGYCQAVPYSDLNQTITFAPYSYDAENNSLRIKLEEATAIINKLNSIIKLLVETR